MDHRRYKLMRLSWTPCKQAKCATKSVSTFALEPDPAPVSTNHSHKSNLAVRVYCAGCQSIPLSDGP
eukprot:5311228-Karenia_brevis.AAC.1